MSIQRARRRTSKAGASLLAVTTAVLLTACRDDVRAASAPPLALRSALSPRAARPELPVKTTWDAGVSRRDFVLAADGIMGALENAGLPPSLSEALDEAFVTRVDLFAHVQPGRQLSIWTRDDKLVAAKLMLTPNASLFAAQYDGARAPHGFYDASGNSLAGTLLARPVALRRITSRFGQRFDAFTGKAAIHHGVDYGVPRGTQVVAVGRGRVVAIGSSKTAGNFIKVAHTDGYESLHLDAVADALRVGAFVEQGQHLADSGNTGRSTGPHLHYELRLAGIPVDPLAVLPMPTVALGPLARREHLAFLNNLEAMHDRRADEQDQHPRARP